LEINEVPMFSIVNIAEIFHRPLAEIFQGGKQAIPELDGTVRWFEFVVIQGQVLEGKSQRTADGRNAWPDAPISYFSHSCELDSIPSSTGA
jgi:hypothetical protein